jgi:carbon storage regulator CsrA
MLVLTRKPDQEIIIPGLGVTITLLQIQQNQARIGIDAPPQAQILRRELESAYNGESLLAAGQTMSHDARNRVNSLALNITLLDKMVAARKPAAEINSVMAKIKQEIGLLSKQTTPSPPPPPLPGRAVKTLIVEDDQSNRESLTALLRLAGVPVDSTSTAEDALDMLDRTRYEAVLLDLGLGGRMDGEAVARHIERLEPERRPKVYVVSARTNTRRFPVAGWFQKPYDPNAILNQLIAR